MENYIFCLTIIIFCVFALITFVITTNKIVNAIQKEKNDLLNRVMSKDYKEYAVFEHNKEVLKAETIAQKIMQPDQDVYRVD
jgi:Na+-translocating ferredoxin:NAD+ oxidoreductase RnfG subunit